MKNAFFFFEQKFVNLFCDYVNSTEYGRNGVLDKVKKESTII